ncbi:MAG TPA: BamA/TamA family outer membrane protein [Woeseiaceae bacterium]|nr:BamA/TamA family outer membrane protein [Woeseiaceae bacterium]
MVLLVLCATNVAADELEYVVKGVEDPLKANVLSHLERIQIGRDARLADRDYAEVIANAEKRARTALRPFGYYRPDVRGQVQHRSDNTLRLTLSINAGPPMIVTAADVQVVGAGANREEFRKWRDSWPLGPGSVLNQPLWEERKVHAIESAEALGYRGVEFSEHAIELDLDENAAVLRLTLDTGPQYVFGDIDFGEHLLKSGILESIPRFSKGEPYRSRLVDMFRIDLWKTRYFSSVDVTELDQPAGSPPQVNLKVELETEHRDVYQGSVGTGTDTGLRLQAQWSRTPVSRNGDRLDVGLGWQNADEEFSAHTNYRRPRLTRQRQYWVAEFLAKLENMDLEIKRFPEDEDYIKIGNGDVTDFNFLVGRLKIRNLERGDQQMFETVYVQFLNSGQTFDLLLLPPQLESDYERLINNTDNNFSLGYKANLTDVWGKGFDTEGRRDRAWIFHSNKALGSAREFTQAYLGTRRIYRKGEHWKFLVRGEVGYTQASVDNLDIDFGIGDGPVRVSVTELPSFYRFKAGGSESVRGYGFETLSNNDIGSNHIITASIEVERKVFRRWSAAAFFDIGNAFNEWKDPDLRKGAGFGIRWYSIAGPVSLDYARALDVAGKPWRIHFTIGTPLL